MAVWACSPVGPWLPDGIKITRSADALTDALPKRNLLLHSVAARAEARSQQPAQQPVPQAETDLGREESEKICT